MLQYNISQFIGQSVISGLESCHCQSFHEFLVHSCQGNATRQRYHVYEFPGQNEAANVHSIHRCLKSLNRLFNFSYIVLEKSSGTVFFKSIHHNLLQ